MNSNDLPGDPLPPAAAPNPAPAAADADLAHPFLEIRRLQTILAASLGALIILGLGVVLFIGKQMTATQARLAIDRQNAQQLYTEFTLNAAPKVRTFIRSLQTFASTNREFAPVLEKYRPVLAPYFPPASPASPAPQK